MLLVCEGLAPDHAVRNLSGLVTAHAVPTVEREVVRLMTVETVTEHLARDPAVERRLSRNIGVAARGSARPSGLGRLGLLVGVVARGASTLMRIALRHGDEGPHHMAAQALALIRKDRCIHRASEDTRFESYRGYEGVARRTVDGQLTHRPQLHGFVLVAPGLRTRPVDRGELVHGGRVALDALQPLERRIVRVQVRAVTRRVRDESPLLRITLDVTLGARLVWDLGVRA
jgi:hypothetical protein